MPSPAALSRTEKDRVEPREESGRRPRHSGGFERPPSRDFRLQELKARVVAALLQSGYAALDFIGCDVEPNRVILYGTVPSYHMKQLAQVFVQRVDGVGRVENRLAVERRRPA
jgi:hypothetical protein